MEKNTNTQKEYYNKALEKILKNYITHKQYGEYAEILENIFQRRAYEYGFSESEIEMQVKNFVRNVKKIKFAPQRKFLHNDTAASYQGKNILLNQDYYIRKEKECGPIFFGIDMYSALSHEVYHAIANAKGNIGITYYNEDWEREGVALDEIFTEAASYRTSFDKYDEFDSYTSGYTEISFGINLLAAALGTTEKELLKKGMSNRSDLMALLNSKFSSKEDADKAQDIFKKFEESLNIIYNLEYQIDKSEDFKDNEGIERELRRTALSSLYESIYNLASLQISSDKMNTSQKYVSEVVYRFLKIGTIMGDSMYRVITRCTEDILKVVLGTEESRKQLADKIIAMQELSKNFDSFSDYGSYYKEFESAKKGMDSERRRQIFEKYGIEIPEDSIKILNDMEVPQEYSEYIFREDLDSGKKWDNTRIAEVMRSIYIREMERKGKREKEVIADYSSGNMGVFDKAIKAINLLITKFKNKGLPQLNAAETGEQAFPERNSQVSEFDRRYKVDIVVTNVSNNSNKTNENELRRNNSSRNDKKGERIE